jgi:hypothetical protein
MRELSVFTNSLGKLQRNVPFITLHHCSGTHAHVVFGLVTEQLSQRAELVMPSARTVHGMQSKNRAQFKQSGEKKKGMEADISIVIG